MTLGEHVMQDYASTSLSLKAHPVSFLRRKLNELQVTPTAGLSSMKNGQFVKVCGLITVRQRPGTAKGVLFITIEDETGFANLVVWSKTFEKYRKTDSSIQAAYGVRETTDRRRSHPCGGQYLLQPE